MATEKEIKKELEIALKEVGLIKPKFDKKTNCWVFSHKLYPVSYGGETPEEVIKNYPLYLREFIKHRIDGCLAESIESRTYGRGGRRPGAGRPKGTTKEAKTRMYVPIPFAEWIRKPENLKWIGSKDNLKKLDRLIHG